jgi:hypothetical protein
LAPSQRFAEVFEEKDVFGILTVSIFALTSAASSTTRAKNAGEVSILGD